MKDIVVLFLVLLLGTHKGAAQGPVKEYVQENAKPLSSVEPGDTNFSDLEVIGQAIGDRRIVMLGELGHGDGTTMAAKSRLVRYLNEKLGFSVLAFESDFFSLNKGWEAFEQKDISIDYLMQSSIYPVWTLCKQNRPLFEYIKARSASPNRIILTGFDIQSMTAFSKRYLKKELDGFLSSADIPFVESSAYKHFLSLIDSVSAMNVGQSRGYLDTLVRYSDTILTQLKFHATTSDFQIRVLDNVRTFCLQVKNYWESDRTGAGAHGIRDKKMAENLEWLVRVKYPMEKIIVWAHNYHISKNADSVYNIRHKDPYLMGYHFTRDSALFRQTYVLGFTEYSGQGRFATSKEIVQLTRPRKNSLEYWLRELNHPFSFIDFTAYACKYPQSRETFYMKRDYRTDGRSYWYNIYDGIFYIERMEPCETINGLLNHERPANQGQ